MLRDAATTLILQRLGNKSASEYLAIVESEILLAQETLEGDATLPSFFLVGGYLVPVITPGSNIVAIPAEFLLEVEDQPMQVLDVASQKYIDLDKDDLQALANFYADAEPAQPEAYAIVGVNFHVFPTPDIAYTLRLLAAQKAALLSTNIENTWLKYASDLLIAQTAYMVASKHLQDFDLATAMVADLKVAKDRLWRLSEARMHTNRNYQMGDD